MSTENLNLDALNDAQRQAVSAPAGNILVLAGAGSGKTRTLVHRIAWLIQQGHASRYNVLAVTFTNKAAHEMRARLEAQLNLSLAGMWIGTFHSIAHRFLRTHWQEAGLPQEFQILDSDDQLRLIRRLHKSLNLDETRWPPKKSQWFINASKDAGKRPAAINPGADPIKKGLLEVYEQYEIQCQQAGLVDFAELLLRAYETLQNNESLLTHYQERFQHIVVDEFQDTNTIQYAWLRLLANANTDVMAVGDDDQSIYSWRGAQSDNLKRFQKEFTDVSVIVLKQNYRSTGNILTVANQVISKNKDRIGKALWTAGNQGEPVSLFCARNEFDEARFIVNQIQAWVDQGNRYSETAILYRSNAQSRVLEEILRSANMPYRVYGGQRFFERAEIKDALAYLRLLPNRNDDNAFERIINTPTRGIGNTTLNVLRNHAQESSLSLWDATADALKTAVFGSRAAHCLQDFIALIDDLDKKTQSLDLPDQLKYVIADSGLRDHFKQDKTEKGLARLENLDELITAARQFQIEQGVASDNRALTPRELLREFIAQVTLDAGDDGSGDNEKDCVQLMTLHAAKGLEFPVVFLSGLEQGLFPHQLSLQDPKRLEEERRLCYVGMTRAKQKLFLIYAETRRTHGRDNFNLPSPFILEIPEELIERLPSTAPPIARERSSYISRQRQQSYSRQQPSYGHRRKTQTETTYRQTPPRHSVDTEIEGTSLQIGQQIKHRKFGLGTILNHEGRGEHARVQIKFVQAGIKWLVLSYAKLEPVQ